MYVYKGTKSCVRMYIKDLQGENYIHRYLQEATKIMCRFRVHYIRGVPNTGCLELLYRSYL